MAYNHDKERIEFTTVTNSNRNGTPVGFQLLSAPAKEFKTINNSISRVIQINQRILLSEVWDGVDHRTNTKMLGSKYKNDTHTSNIYIN